MTESESLEAAIHEQVALAPWQADWSARFDAERARLGEALPGVFIELQHIGSTAVPGLAAKPVIDILAGVDSMATAMALADRLGRAGYTTLREFNAALHDRQWFMRHADGHRTHHLHVAAHGELFWRERIAFRDALRADPELASRYATLKAELAERHRSDRDAYTEAKGDFVRAVLEAGVQRRASPPA